MHGDFQIIDRDDPYVKYANGVVLDSNTGLEWFAARNNLSRGKGETQHDPVAGNPCLVGLVSGAG